MSLRGCAALTLAVAGLAPGGTAPAHAEVFVAYNNGATAVIHIVDPPSTSDPLIELDCHATVSAPDPDAPDTNVAKVTLVSGIVVSPVASARVVAATEVTCWLPDGELVLGDQTMLLPGTSSANASVFHAQLFGFTLCVSGRYLLTNGAAVPVEPRCKSPSFFGTVGA